MSAGAAVLQLALRRYDLPFVRPVNTSQVRAVRRQGWHLLLAAASGRGPDAAVGMGEIAPWPGFGTASAKLALALERLPGQLALSPAAAADPWAPPLLVAAEVTAAVADRLQGPLPCELQWALDLATLDWLGQRRGVPVAHLLSEAPLAQVAVHAQIASAVAGQRARDEGFAAFKLKVGSRALDEEGAHVAAVRVAIGQQAALRLDANGAWSSARAVQALRLLAAYAPDWVEQPIARGNVEQMAALVRQAIVPVAVDEGAASLADVAAHLQAGAADVIVIKPAFVGGVTAALSAAALARRRGARLCLTHAFDSQVGCLGALHLAAGLRLRAPCGLLPALHEPAVPAALTARAGLLRLGDAPGLGPHAHRADAPPVATPGQVPGEIR